MRWHLVIVAGIAISLILFGVLLPYSFTQDDFYLLRQATFHSLKEQLLVSLPREDSIYFRPLGMQGYFYLARRLLGVYPWAYRLVAIFVHTINGLLVFLLAKKLSPPVAGIVWFFYLTAPLHFAAIGWIANISFLTGTTLVLAALIASSSPRMSWTLSVFLFLTALLTNELAIVYPILLLIFRWWREGNVSLPKGRQGYLVTVSSVMAVLYTGFRFITPHAWEGPYSASIGNHLAGNLRWLTLWAFGWVEASKDYFTGPVSLRWEFSRTFPVESLFMTVVSVTMVIILVRSVLKDRYCLLGIAWFIVSVLPVLFFRQHLFPHYAMIASIGIFLMIGYALEPLPRLLIALILVLWSIQAIAVTRLNVATHWWAQHSRLTQTLIRQMKERYLQLPAGKVIVVESAEPERAVTVLSGDNAAQVIYNDPTAKTIFSRRP